MELTDAVRADMPDSGDTGGDFLRLPHRWRNQEHDEIRPWSQASREGCHARGAPRTVQLDRAQHENSRYYVLTVLRGGYQVEVLREIWFDRADLLVSRLQTFGPKGLLLSDVHLANWEPIDNAAGQSAAAQVLGTASFPRAIRIDRPHDDYKLDLQITKISLNEAMPVERFKLEQPAGAELVRVGEATENKQP